MNVETTIRSSRLLQISFNVCWLNRGELDMLPFERRQEILSYNDTPTHSLRRVSFLFQVVSQF
jgi:hypothetical protein